MGLVISVITIASTGDRKAIHDFLGRTVVLRGAPPEALLSHGESQPLSSSHRFG